MAINLANGVFTPTPDDTGTRQGTIMISSGGYCRNIRWQAFNRIGIDCALPLIIADLGAAVIPPTTHYTIILTGTGMICATDNLHDSSQPNHLLRNGLISLRAIAGIT